MSDHTKPSPMLTRSISTSSKNIQASTSKTDPSIKDILKAIDGLRDTQIKVSTDNKALGVELKQRLDTLASRFDVLSNEITALRTKVFTIDERVLTLESNSQPAQQLHMSDVIHEFSEREKCKSNIIVHGLSESSSNLPSSKISDDKIALSALFMKFIDTSYDFKSFRLGKSSPSSTRPVKVIFSCHDVAAQVLSAFRTAKSRSDVQLPFKLVRDKTAQEREELKACHKELDNRVNAGESDLTITYRNGIPCVIKSQSKNRSTKRLQTPF